MTIRFSKVRVQNWATFYIFPSIWFLETHLRARSYAIIWLFIRCIAISDTFHLKKNNENETIHNMNSGYSNSDLIQYFHIKPLYLPQGSKSVQILYIYKRLMLLAVLEFYRQGWLEHHQVDLESYRISVAPFYYILAKMSPCQIEVPCRLFLLSIRPRFLIWNDRRYNKKGNE